MVDPLLVLGAAKGLLGFADKHAERNSQERQRLLELANAREERQHEMEKEQRQYEAQKQVLWGGIYGQLIDGSIQLTKQSINVFRDIKQMQMNSNERIALIKANSDQNLKNIEKAYDAYVMFLESNNNRHKNLIEEQKIVSADIQSVMQLLATPNLAKDIKKTANAQLDRIMEYREQIRNQLLRVTQDLSEIQMKVPELVDLDNGLSNREVRIIDSNHVGDNLLLENRG